jgi:hypothetical protein
MARQRKYDLDKQTHFAKTHREVMKGVYMSDVDSLQIIDTENQVYHQNRYDNRINSFYGTTPLVRRTIEVKYKMSDYLKRMFAGEIEPSNQVIAQAYFIAEANAFKRERKLPEVDYWFVVENEGKFPYEIWSVTTFPTGELQFKQIGTVMDKAEYNAFFDIR